MGYILRSKVTAKNYKTVLSTFVVDSHISIVDNHISIVTDI